MKERPILFSAPMVQAILEGKKTQTRRVIKPQPKLIELIDGSHSFAVQKSKGIYNGLGMKEMVEQCPYGQVGDQLWVREAWGYHDPDGTGEDFESPACGTSSEYMLHQENETLLNFWLRRIAYRATFKYPRHGIGPDAPKKWRPSIHMPRWASRIQLEITKIRVERLNDISEDDAIAEGITYAQLPNNIQDAERAKTWYRGLWATINGAESWQVNPWVWVVEFKVIKP